MSWLRYSDDFTDWPEWEMASTDVRWAYVCLVEACSRAQRWDGLLPKPRALAALVAQVDDPQQCLERLAILSLIHEDRRERIVILPRIGEHVPPPHVRVSKDQTKIRTRRYRAHKVGDHSLCLPKNCDQMGTVTDLVTRHVTDHIGTGRDGKSSAPVTSGTCRACGEPMAPLLVNSGSLNHPSCAEAAS